jgi:hypothetical protein
MTNLLPACKNAGVTHITNGCYRLHPVEWNIGEAAGALAAYCLDRDLIPTQVRNDRGHLSNFQPTTASSDSSAGPGLAYSTSAMTSPP